MPPKAKKPASAAKKPVSKAKTPVSKAKKRARDSESESDNLSDAASPSKKPKKDDDAVDKKKMVTILKRGAAPVDPYSNFVDTHQVYEGDGEVWDAMLNQTDISGTTNSNKFYVIQLLHQGSGNCVLFTRWGRVGEVGANQIKGPWPAAEAIFQFKKQFRSKTGTAWEQRHGMTAKKGKYMWLQRTFEQGDDKDDKQASGSGLPQEREKTPESTLCPEVQELCKLIFSTTLLSAHLSSMNYDANKLPLGKLAKATILKGFAVLKELAEAIEDPNPASYNDRGGFRTICADLSSRYYSIVPHDFGRVRPPVIDNMILLKKELEILDALGDMEVAQNIISTKTPGNVQNPLDAHLGSLNLSSISPVAQGSKEFTTLVEYVQDTHGETHQWYQAHVMDIFRIERADEAKAFTEAGYDKLADGERMLLWHGSRTTNYAGILKQGLRIAPPEAPVSGYMFGKGVYLADMMSKSANYCHAHLSGGVGLLLLCEAAVRPFHELKNADMNADQGCKAATALATKGLGMTQPVQWQDAGIALEYPELAGVHMPKGGGRGVNIGGLNLQYNEYIVYQPSQIRLRYLLMVKMQ
ncbi:PARP-domain-containing protein [Ramaria rubella]|nr:PARP-domain-containing protein [Ramaria rubella]